MQYMTARQAAEKWGVSLRYVQRLLYDGRIPGVQKYGRSWMVPYNAEKPLDPRKARRLPQERQTHYLFLTTADLLKNDPHDALSGIEDAFRPLAAADLAFRRGDPRPAKALWRATTRDDTTKLTVASLATAAAISSGDYALYNEIRLFLNEQISACENDREKALLSLPETMATVSMALPGMTPEWLKKCDFSLFPIELRPFLLYLYALHLRTIGDYNAMLDTARTTLLLCEKGDSFTRRIRG